MAPSVSIQKPAKSRLRSAQRRSGLIFPIGRLKRILKRGSYSKRLGGLAPIYLAAVLEYLTCEVLDISVDASRLFKKSRIAPRHIQIGIRQDEELDKLFLQVTLPDGGFVSKIKPVIVTQSKN